MATLEELRGQLDVVDDQIVKLYEERMKICEQVGEYKVEAGRKVFDRVREKEKLQNVASKVSSDFDKKGIQELYRAAYVHEPQVTVSAACEGRSSWKTSFYRD